MTYEISRAEYDELLNKARLETVRDIGLRARNLIVELGTTFDQMSMLVHTEKRIWFHETDQTLGTMVHDLMDILNDENA